MGDSGTVTTRILEALLEAGLVTVEQSSTVIHTAEQEGRSIGELIEQRDLVSADDLSGVLEGRLGVPRVDLASYAPDDEALALLSAPAAHKMGMLPLFEIDGVLTVATSDPFRLFRLDGVSQELSLEVEAVLTDPRSLQEALDQYYPRGEGETDPHDARGPEASTLILSKEVSEDEGFDAADLFEVTPGHKTIVVPAYDEIDEGSVAHGEHLVDVVEARPGATVGGIDLDVLAVADASRVAGLVAKILAHAVECGASRIHILPYKDDFFLVYRVGGRLEKIASAPLSMQAALVDGFRSFARLEAASPLLPAVNRVRARVGDRDLAVTVSAVQTIAGRRVVVSFASATDAPPSLQQLGMSDAESLALRAMLERGRGVLLVCAPIAGGRSTTYYALLSYAASFGRTVYSVERSVEYEIPAVAQVLVSSGAHYPADAYLAAGVRQDTDVIAIDPLQTVGDIHHAIEAAGRGKLVIATFTGGGIAASVSRMLDLGAEPVSLASALTLGVGQRLVRLTCQKCVQEDPGSLARSIPGAQPDISGLHGVGCPACVMSGFSGLTGLFEVLPFTDPVRGVISRGASADEISVAAAAVGMRSMLASGLAKVQEGVVSAAELNRVLRFIE